MNGVDTETIVIKAAMTAATTTETVGVPGGEAFTVGLLNLTTPTAPGIQPPYWEPYLVAVLATVLSVVMVISIVGNSLIILAMVFFKGMRSKTNLFITNLACADLGVSVLCMPVSLATVIQGDWMFGEVVCNINAFFEALFLVASTHGLMIIALHKFFSLVMPLRRLVNLRRAIAMVIFAWFIGLTCAIGPVVGLSRNTYKPGTSQCGPKYPETLTEKISGLYVPIVGIFIPLICLIIVYSVIFNTIRKYSRRLRHHTSMTADRIFHQQKRITITLFIVFVAFFLCWTPYFIYSILGFTVGFKRVPTILNVIAYWSGYTNSALNPIIYAWRAKSYRKAFKKICCCKVQSGVISDTGTAYNGEFASPYLPRRRRAIRGNPLPGSKSSSQSSILKMSPSPRATALVTQPTANGAGHKGGILLPHMTSNGRAALPAYRDIPSDSDDDEVFVVDPNRRKSENDKDCLEQRHFDLPPRVRDRLAYRSDPGRKQMKKSLSNGHDPLAPTESPTPFKSDWVPDAKAQRALRGRSTLV